MPAVVIQCGPFVCSDGRRARAVHLIQGGVLNLLQASEREEQARHTGRWNREEGKNVARLLGEKSLIKTSTSEGGVKANNVMLKKMIYCCTAGRVTLLNLFLRLYGLSSKYVLNNPLNQVWTYQKAASKAETPPLESSGLLSHQTPCCRC